MRKGLNETGTPWLALKDQLEDIRGHDIDWRAGRSHVYVFHSGDEVLQVAHDAYGMFIAENALGPGAFPSLKRMESEVLNWALDLQEAPESAAGSMTSGGTESIILALKTCRDHARANGLKVNTPEVVAPYSVHPAFDKGAQLLGLKIVRVPLQNFVADVDAMESAVNEDTIMLVGSAPCFPYGLTDPITGLSDLARSKDLWLHVDACVGGYIAPFVQRLGEKGEMVEDYNFSLPGVTSMSADLHKYGYAAKGASTVLYRDKSLRKHQVFEFSNWPSGHMYTPTLNGTRPGGAIAAAWAVMGFLGVEGYKKLAERICNTRNKIADAVSSMGFTVFGSPQLSLISFGSQEFDVLAVGEGLYQKGWMSSRTQDPDGIHLMISPEHDQSVDEYLDVLAALVEEVRSGKRQRASSDITYS